MFFLCLIRFRNLHECLPEGTRLPRPRGTVRCLGASAGVYGISTCAGGSNDCTGTAIPRKVPLPPVSAGAFGMTLEVVVVDNGEHNADSETK